MNGDVGTGGQPSTPANNDENNAEIVALREKLALLQQIQQLQSQLNLNGTDPSRTQPAMRIKLPEGSYSKSQGDYRTYKKRCRDLQRIDQAF